MAEFFFALIHEHGHTGYDGQGVSTLGQRRGEVSPFVSLTGLAPPLENLETGGISP